jgi:DNA-binding NtrC family response regulator
MAAAMKPTTRKPQVLFVDDEQRVLNSMRIMFRREFDLHLANSGKEALAIVAGGNIDVIVADHRMPQMTGVEVLTQVRTMSPRTVRILLTGYADLDAVEGSINDGEVFRFLTKPCPPDQLRETLALAVKVAQESPAAEPEIEAESVIGDSAEPAKPAANAIEAVPARAAVTRERLAQGLGIVVFTADEEVLTTVQRAVRGRLPVYSATNIVKVVKILTEQRPGVLLTDISDDKATIQAMTARLKEHLPELVTIAVSPHRDVLDMVWLINHGQIFRFLRKPLSPGRCAVSLQAALKHHRMLLKNPDMVQRYKVEATDEAGLMGGVMAKLRNVRRLWASA